MTIPRGIRNHNPLNIRRSKDQWKGLLRHAARLGPLSPRCLKVNDGELSIVIDVEQFDKACHGENLLNLTCNVLQD